MGVSEQPMPDGTKVAILHVESVNGSFVFVLNREMSRSIGDALRAFADKPDLTVPPANIDLSQLGIPPQNGGRP